MSLVLCMSLFTVNAVQASEANDLFGAPWVNSIVDGNIPQEAPDVKDDLFLHYTYDTLQLHQGEQWRPSFDKPAMETYLTEIMEGSQGNGLATAGCSEAEWEQLSIFYQQASDLDALQEAGISELQPWLDQIQNAASIEELNDVLVSDDFPFSPYLYFIVQAYDMSGTNNVFVYPQFLFVDNLDGAKYYQDTDDENIKLAYNMTISDGASTALLDLFLLGLSQEEGLPLIKEMLDIEKSYGKDAYFSNKYPQEEYGAYSVALSNLSIEEIADLCPNYPVKETIEKFGKQDSPFFSVFEKGWLESFNEIWTEDNLDTLKNLTIVKILHECENFLDRSITNSFRVDSGIDPIDGKTNALNACNMPGTFSELTGKIYVTDHYSEEDITRLTEFTEDLINVFKDLLNDTSWLCDSSKEKMLLKLDNLRLNLLIPDGGYHDYSDPVLTKSEDGGTLLGNYLTLKAYHNKKENELLGQPALSDMNWRYYGPSLVNASYEAKENCINLFPGFISSGFMYHSDMSDEEMYGKIGWVIAHEMSHGFDYKNSQMDAYGLGNSIFDDDDLDEYLEKVDQVVSYSNTMEPFPGVFENGVLVRGEAAADMIGLQILLEKANGESDFDYEAFFQSCAEEYERVLSADTILNQVYSDVHPLAYLRVNVSLQMNDNLYDVYGISEGDGMYLPKEERILFWGE